MAGMLSAATDTGVPEEEDSGDKVPPMVGLLADADADTDDAADAALA